MAKYVKKPIEVEARQLTRRWAQACLKFVGEENIANYNLGEDEKSDCFITIRTSEGDMVAQEGDYIIQGIQGEFYPCKEEIFKKTYAEVK